MHIMMNRFSQLLIKALDGRFDQSFGTGGSASIVLFPASGESPITTNRRADSGMSLASGDMISALDLDPSLPVSQATEIEQLPNQSDPHA
jgi:hypothetical protein